MSTLVMKFGGTSTGNEDTLNRAADIVGAQIGEWDQIVVVVSAMEGVTDMLLESADRALNGSFQIAIEDLHHKLCSIVSTMFVCDEHLLELIDARIAELVHICQRIRDQGVASPPDLAQIAALGERIQVHIFSAVLGERGLRSEPIDATDLIITDDCFQSASPIKSLTDERIKARLSPMLAETVIPVVTGFIGATTSGETTTLGRGGSDYTAAIIAESLEADEIWIWTDVDGVMTADPGLIPGARLIPEISYNEVFQLACSGAKVLHPKTILPAMEGNIPLIIKNTFNPECSGTRIGHCSSTVKNTVSAVTGLFEINTINFEIQPGEDVSKVKSLFLAALKNQGTPTLAVFQAKQGRSISFAISANNVDRVLQTIREFRTLKSFDRTIPQPQVNGNISLITIVGRDIYLSPQVLSIVSSTLEKAGVEIKRIGNGNSPDAIVIAVEDQIGWKAIQQIHDRVVLNGNPINPQTQPDLRHQPAM